MEVRRRTAGLGLCCLLLTGCADPGLEEWPGRYVTLTSSDGVAPCGGTLDFLDRFVPYVYQYWTGEVLPDSFNATVELRGGSEDGYRGQAEIGGDFAWASGSFVVLHEVNHLVIGAPDGSSAPVFAEGVAEMLAPSDLDGVWGAALGDPESFAFLPRSAWNGREYYAPSAQLMRSLIHRYGREQVREAYRTASASNDAAQNESVFVEVFGDGIYDAFEAYRTEWQCGLQAWECSEDLLAVLDLPVVIDSPADCGDDERFFGASADGEGRWFPVQRFIVELAQETDVRIDLENATLRRERCVSQCERVTDPDYWPLDYVDEQGVDDSWAAGRYTIAVYPRDPSSPFHASLRRRP